MLTKGIRLKKGPLTVSRQSRHCLSKDTKGKGIASPLDMGYPMGKRSTPSMDKAKATAIARLRDLFNPNYEPREEVLDEWDRLELEDMEAIKSFCGDSSWLI